MDEIQQHLPLVKFDLLDQLYSDYKIDVDTEQQKLIDADVIVLQFPLFWYSIPALMKKWMEDVFVHGFSHGSIGNKLHGKKLIISFTYGAPESMYKHRAPQNYTIDEFMLPLRQFANLCGLDWEGYISTGGLSYLSHHDDIKVKAMRDEAIVHANRLLSKLNEL